MVHNNRNPPKKQYIQFDIFIINLNTTEYDKTVLWDWLNFFFNFFHNKSFYKIKFFKIIQSLFNTLWHVLHCYVKGKGRNFTFVNLKLYKHYLKHYDLFSIVLRKEREGISVLKLKLYKHNYKNITICLAMLY